MEKRHPTTILVQLPLSRREHAGGLEEVANVMQPLGLGYLAAVLERQGVSVRIIDCRPSRMDLDALIRSLEEEQPDLIGMTATILEIAKAREAAALLRKRLPQACLIIGGPQFSADPANTLKGSDFDLGVIGEGEHTLLDIVAAWDADKTWLAEKAPRIPGVAYLDAGGEVRLSPPRPFIANLDDLPFPARHLYPPLSSYSPVPASYIRLPLGHVITSRGCPHHCIFCDRTVFGNRFRARSPKNVMAEIEQLVRLHGAKEVKFFDDTFTMDRKRVLDILSEMKAAGLRIPWSCLTRVDRVDRELLMAMKAGGCWQIALGLESGDEKMLESMKKGITLEQNRRAVLWAKRAGLQVRAFFVIGMPGETRESIARTVAFAKSLPIDVVNFYSVTLYPGNELYKRVLEEGKIRHQDYTQYNPLIDVKTSRLAYVPEGMTEEEVKEAIASGHKAFYFRPSFALRQILSIRSLEDVKRYIRGFLAVLRA